MKTNLGQCCLTIWAQWGDEGKWKLIDILAEEFDIIARAAGGANAGHTICINDDIFVFHLMPSGVLNGKTCIIGNGCVVHLPALLEEMNYLEEKNIKIDLLISNKAHILFDFHKSIDGILEDRRGKSKIWSTKRWIGPCYTTKTIRSGLRIWDLIYDFDFFKEQLTKLVKDVNAEYGLSIDIEAELILYTSIKSKFEKMVINTSKFLEDALKDWKKVLIEWAQWAMLDLDHGTYPYVTSSNTCSWGSCAGLWIPPNKIDSVIGITKAYTTRVGAWPFPTEMIGADWEMLRQLWHEFWATTWRPRRCGWLDSVQMKSAQRVNWFTSINLTKLDVLSGMKELKIAIKYILNGEELFDIPFTKSGQENLEIEYMTLKGWNEDITNCETYDELPKNAKIYIKTIEDLIKIPVNFIWVWPKRTQLFIK